MLNNDLERRIGWGTMKEIKIEHYWKEMLMEKG